MRGAWRNQTVPQQLPPAGPGWKPCLFSGVGDGSAAVLVLGFEQPDHPMNEWMKSPEVVHRHGGSYDAESVERSMRDDGAKNTAAAQPVRGDR